MPCPCASCSQDPCGCPCDQPINEPKRCIADYFMPVGTSGIVFVSPIPALVPANNIPVFTLKDQRTAQWHAASDLADMGLIDGQTLQFIRQAIPMDVPSAAAFLGVSVPTLTDWEANTTVVPRDMWLTMAQRVRDLAQEYGPPVVALNPPDFRPRVIRVFTPISDYYHSGSYPS